MQDEDDKARHWLLLAIIAVVIGFSFEPTPTAERPTTVADDLWQAQFITEPFWEK